MSGVDLTKEVLALREENENLKAVLNDATKSLRELVDLGNENARLSEELEGQHELNTRLRKDLLSANDEAYRPGAKSALARRIWHTADRLLKDRERLNKDMRP